MIPCISVNRASQINFMLCRRRDWVEVKECKIILNDFASAYYHHVAQDLAISHAKENRINGKAKKE